MNFVCLSDVQWEGTEPHLPMDLNERGPRPVIPNPRKKKPTVQLQQAFPQAALQRRGKGGRIFLGQLIVAGGLKSFNLLNALSMLYWVCRGLR